MGGKGGACGNNFLIKTDGDIVYLRGKNTIDVEPGEILQILTPGGGGWCSAT